MKASVTLGRIAGIEIGVHYSWVLAFALVAVTLAVGFFPTVYPDWFVATYWVTGIVAAILLFVSVLVHEMSHSLVARARGLPVHGITLFIFGGVSNLRGEAKEARDEFLITIVGPLTSALLGGAFWGLSFLVPDQQSPVAAILFYLGIINVILAAFNLLPGFPLDGGRVLRSILWGATGSLRKATDISATVGRIFGWVLIGWGVFLALQGNIIGGLWTAFIGWFLSTVADASRKDVALQETFHEVKVDSMMEKDPETVTPEVSLQEIVTESFLRRGHRAVPVCDDGQLVGIVSITDIKDIPREQWASTAVGQVMTQQPLHRVSADDDLTQALNLMNEHDVHQILVTDDGSLEGLINRAHVVRYLQSIDDLGITPNVNPANSKSVPST